MTINFPMIFKTPSTDGLSVKSQSRDLETTAPVPFDEFLKDEEKKLRQEQEVSASSVAAVLSALQPQPASVTAAPVQVTEGEGESVNSDGMRASTLQPITTQQSVNSLSSQAGSASSLVENLTSTAGNQTDAAQPQANQSFADDLATPEVPQSTINAVGSAEVFPAAVANLDPASDQGAILEETNKSMKDAKPDSANTSETAFPDLPAIQAVGTQKIQPDQDGLLPVQIKPEGEDPIPSAKEQEPVLKLEGLTIAAKGTETPVVKEAGSFSITDVNVQTSEVIQQIMSQMKIRMKGGATSMRLLLNPKELGEIEVQMVRNTQGVSVTFIAEQANTGKMLEIQINQLRQSLKDAGVQLTDLNFSQHNQPKQEGGFLRQSPQFSQYLPASTPQTEIVNKVLERPERIDGLSNEVDYLI